VWHVPLVALDGLREQSEEDQPVIVVAVDGHPGDAAGRDVEEPIRKE